MFLKSEQQQIMFIVYWFIKYSKPKSLLGMRTGSCLVFGQHFYVHTYYYTHKLLTCSNIHRNKGLKGIIKVPDFHLEFFSSSKNLYKYLIWSSTLKWRQSIQRLGSSQYSHRTTDWNETQSARSPFALEFFYRLKVSK